MLKNILRPLDKNHRIFPPCGGRLGMGDLPPSCPSLTISRPRDLPAPCMPYVHWLSGQITVVCPHFSCRVWLLCNKVNASQIFLLTQRLLAFRIRALSRNDDAFATRMNMKQIAKSELYAFERQLRPCTHSPSGNMTQANRESEDGTRPGREIA